MQMSKTDALFHSGALYLATNDSVRKSHTVSEFRCKAKGCYLGGVVSLNKQFYVLRKLRVREFRYGALSGGIPARSGSMQLNIEEASVMPLEEFLRVVQDVDVEHLEASYRAIYGAGVIWELWPARLMCQLRCEHVHHFVNLEADGIPQAKKIKI